MTSAKFLGFLTPFLTLVSTKSTQLSFLWSEIGQPPPLSAAVICRCPLKKLPRFLCFFKREYSPSNWGDLNVDAITAYSKHVTDHANEVMERAKKCKPDSLTFDVYKYLQGPSIIYARKQTSTPLFSFKFLFPSGCVIYGWLLRPCRTRCRRLATAARGRRRTGWPPSWRPPSSSS